MKYLITGTAGFIGYHMSKRLLEMNENVVGIDNINNYYDVSVKYDRLSELGIKETNIKDDTVCFSNKFSGFKFLKIDISNKSTLENLFEKEKFDFVINFAAQAGVMYSTINPNSYIQSNIVGFINVLECCKNYKSTLIYASSSSVYGDNKTPFCETDLIDKPKNLYANTKFQNEQLAEIYSEYFGINIIGLRLFSVYGPHGRPDMAYMLFTKAINNQQPIKIYGNGTSSRDYTYIDDVIHSIIQLKNYYKNKTVKNEIFNIGSEKPISLLELINDLENNLGSKTSKENLHKRNEEMDITFSDSKKLLKTINFKPNTDFKTGMKHFCDWWVNKNSR